MDKDSGYTGLSIFTVETYQPLDACPRITMFHHAIAKDRTYFYEGRRRTQEPHCIFHYTLRGCGQFLADGVYRDVREGQGFLQIINDPGSGYRYPPDSRDPWEFAVFCLDGGNTRALIGNMIDAYGPLFTVPRQHTTLQLLLDEQQLRPGVILNTGAAYRLCAALLSLLMDCAVPLEDYAASSRLLYAIQREVSARQGIRVAELARCLGCSREHLTRQFRAVTGKPLKQYLDEQKLLYVCDLLLNTTLSVGDIAARVQFSTATNFHRFFKDKTGMTPAAFRQRGVLQIPCTSV